MTATDKRKHCALCPDTFHDSSGLRRHMRRKHADAVAVGSAPRHTAEDVRRAVAQLQEELTAAAPGISRVMNEPLPDERPGIEVEPDPADVTQADSEAAAASHARIYGVPEPTRAHDLHDGDTVLWLGEKRTIATIRNVDTGQYLIRFRGGSLRAYVPRRTVVRRFEP